MTKKQILTFLKANKEKFAQKYHIANFILFGSYAREENHQNSDIDLIYSLQEGAKLSFDKYMEFEAELKKAFNNTDVDLVNAKKFNPLIKIEAKKDFIHV
ncbi:MAG: nucleotidyltransferase domain-containing protein [Campylobacterota bacterium]|nr:nucleotidyltransferase domain-containing protein [Campylobacterota bacterium]